MFVAATLLGPVLRHVFDSAAIYALVISGEKSAAGA